MKIEFKLTFDCFEIKNRGTVYTAKLLNDYKRDDLKHLLNQTLWGKQIKGVESFAVDNQSKGMPIGILI